MNEQIKKRISAINIGIIPDGYKKTKVGIVPAEWEIKTLAELCEISAGGDIEKKHCQTTPNEKFKFPVYSNALTNKGLYGYSDIFKISEKTVTVTGRGEIGYAIARNEKYYPIVRLLVLKPKNENINTVFLAHQINESKIYIESTGVPQLTAPQLSLLKIFCPSLKEQIIIAEILSTQDKLIELKQKLIDLKKQQKKWLMQNLLTGKIRLKGFDGEWSHQKFKDVCTFINGRAYKQDELLNIGKYKVLRVGNLFTNGEWYYSDLDLSDDKYIDNGDLIYAWSASFSPYIWNGGKAIYHYHIWKIDRLVNINKTFLFLFLQYDVDNIKSETQGGTMSHITKETMEKRSIIFPSLSEQTAIAEILSHQDKEIDLLEKELELQKQKKKALMQLLLTGKVRVST